jgi:hypothetical protein
LNQKFCLACSYGTIKKETYIFNGFARRTQAKRRGEHLPIVRLIWRMRLGGQLFSLQLASGFSSSLISSLTG